jgi:thioredoxin 1
MHLTILSQCLIAGLLLVSCVKGPVVSEPEIFIPDHAITLTAADFDSLVNVTGLVAMVDFFSPLCPDCREMDSIVDNIAEQFGGKALIGRIDIQEDSLALAYSIGPLPTFVFFSDGVEYERISGITTEDSLSAALNRGLAGKP